MNEVVLKDEKILNVISKKIASLIGNIDPRSVEKQLKEFDEDTTNEIIYKLLYIELESHQSCDLFDLVNFLKDKFKRPVICISDYYKRLSEKLNGKYSPEELELICELEKQLVCSLLKENDIIETKNIVYVKQYAKNCNLLSVSAVPHTDITTIIEQLPEFEEFEL